MNEIRYRVFETDEPEAESRELLKISGGRNLITSLEEFGPHQFNHNVKLMQREYSNPSVERVFSFREPTTVESILAASYHFEKSWGRFLDFSSLQLGRIIRTSEGVFVNPYPAFRNGSSISKRQLNYFLGQCKKVNGIWLDSSKYDFGFAPYESFKQGKQDAEEFAEGGLARVLEHTEGKKAEILAEIASKGYYPGGIIINMGGSDKKLKLGVVRMCVDGAGESKKLYVDEAGPNIKGYAFGVLREKGK